MCVEQIRALHANHPEPAVRAVLSRALVHRACDLVDKAPEPDREAATAMVVEIQSLQEAHPEEPEVAIALAKALHNILVSNFENKWGWSQAEIEARLDHLRRLVAAQPGPETRYLLAAALYNSFFFGINQPSGEMDSITPPLYEIEDLYRVEKAADIRQVLLSMLKTALVAACPLFDLPNLHVMVAMLLATRTLVDEDADPQSIKTLAEMLNMLTAKWMLEALEAARYVYQLDPVQGVGPLAATLAQRSFFLATSPDPAAAVEWKRLQTEQADLVSRHSRSDVPEMLALRLFHEVKRHAGTERAHQPLVTLAKLNEPLKDLQFQEYLQGKRLEGGSSVSTVRLLLAQAMDVHAQALAERPGPTDMEQLTMLVDTLRDLYDEAQMPDSVMVNWYMCTVLLTYAQALFKGPEEGREDGIRALEEVLERCKREEEAEDGMQIHADKASALLAKYS